MIVYLVEYQMGGLVGYQNAFTNWKDAMTEAVLLVKQYCNGTRLPIMRVFPDQNYTIWDLNQFDVGILKTRTVTIRAIAIRGIKVL